MDIRRNIIHFSDVDNLYASGGFAHRVVIISEADSGPEMGKGARNARADQCRLGFRKQLHELGLRYYAAIYAYKGYAFVHSAFYNSLFLVGILIMLVNVLQKKIPGAAFGMLVGFFSYFQKNFSNLYRMSFFSPATWMDIGMWNSEIRLSYPTTDYMTGFLFFTISVMLIVSVAAFERSEDIFMKGEENE